MIKERKNAKNTIFNGEKMRFACTNSVSFIVGCYFKPLSLEIVFFSSYVGLPNDKTEVN